MKFQLAVIGVTLAFAHSNDTLAQTFTQKGFGESRQSKMKCAGQTCPGVNTGHDCGPEDVQITPNPILARAGESMTIRFDATRMCNGQSLKDFSASINLENGATYPLPDSYGLFTYTYTQAGRQKIDIEMAAVCYDLKGKSSCKARGSVPVQVK